MAELGPLQEEVMNIIWRFGQADVNTVLNEINKSRKNKLAYTTVMTVMANLYEKGLLRRRKVGKAYVYRPTYDRGSFILERISEFLSSLTARYREPVASNLIDALEDTSPEEIESLVEELKRRGYIKKR